jgi:hypothetical protein
VGVVSIGPVARDSIIKMLLGWPLWGVLIAGALSSFLWVSGAQLFNGHLTPVLGCIIAVPIIGGILTPERPAYTVVVFAVGSVPPLNDMPPIPIGLWPFFWAFDVLTSDLYPGKWQVLLPGVPGAFAVACSVAAVMCLPYAPLIFLGWAIRRRCGSGNRMGWDPRYRS